MLSVDKIQQVSVTILKEETLKLQTHLTLGLNLKSTVPVSSEFLYVKL